MVNTVLAGTWVQIRQQVLDASERAPQVPSDTAATPLVLLVKGFLVSSAVMGQDAVIRTLSDRELTGELFAVEPAFTHDFGQVVPELLAIGVKARRLLEEGN